MSTTFPPSYAAASVAHLMTRDIPPDMRRRGVLLVLIQYMGQRVTPERMNQLMEVVPEEAVAKRIARPEEATFRGLYLVNAAERRIAGKRTIGQEHAYLTNHILAATARNRARAALRDAEKRWGELLSWRAVRDERTTPDCLALDGKNFYAHSPPGGTPPGAKHLGVAAWLGRP